MSSKLKRIVTALPFSQSPATNKAMPKINDIQETPNPNAVKFILREPVTHGVARQFGSADQAQSDTLAKSLFDVGSVVSVFYMDNMITVEKEEPADWDELLPTLAVPIRAAESVSTTPPGTTAVLGGAIAAVTSDDPRLLQINNILDEKIRTPFLGDGGYFEIIDLPENQIKNRFLGGFRRFPRSFVCALIG